MSIPDRAIDGDQHVCPAKTEAEFDPLDPEMIQNPHAVYASLREEPVFFSERIGMWVVTRHEDVVTVLKDRGKRFSKDEFRPVSELTQETKEILAEGFDRVRTFDTDPPEHNRIRSFTSKIFTPSRMRAMDARIRELANELIDGFIDDGRCEFVDRFAFQLPAMVTFDFLGVPREHMEKVRDWSVAYVELIWDFCPEERQAQAARDNVDYWNFIGDLIEDRRENPTDDVFSVLVNAEAELGTEPLSVSEIISICHHLVIAGHRTTTNLLATTMIHLLGERSRWERVLGDPGLAKVATEEAMRIDAPVMALWYRAKEEVAFGDTRIPARDRVLVVYGSANHDPTVFDDPQVFDLDRAETMRHLSFGFGPHVCAGAPLARVLAPAAIQELARRLPTARLVPQELDYLPLWTSRGPVALEIEWDDVAARGQDGA